MNRKNGFWLFVTSCLSGCGQMYQGYMKRGLSLLLAFYVLLAIAGFLGIDALALFLPVVWLYAFFDSYNLRNQLSGGTAQPDAYLFGLSEMDSRQMNELLHKRHSLVGWVLVVFGVYMLYDTLLAQLDWLMAGWLYSLLRYDMPRLVLTAGIIALGLWFIRGPKAKSVPADDIPTFTPPAAEPASSQAPATFVETVEGSDKAAEVTAVVSDAQTKEVPHGDA